MTKKELVTRSEFARMAGVSAAAVTVACSKTLQPSLVGSRISVKHSSAINYLKKHDGDKTKKVKRKTKTTTTKNSQAHKRGHVVAKENKKTNSVMAADMLLDIPDDIQAFLSMTLGDIIDKFGTDIRFIDWLSATQKIELINEKRLKNAKTEGDLVNRELIRLAIIEPINSAHIKLLSDGSKTIARRVTAMHSAGRSLADVEKFVTDQISSFIRPVKVKIVRALKNA